MYSLLERDELRRLLDSAGINLERSSGQNFLVCSEPVEATVLAAKPGPEKITELGAGIGTLTQALIEAGKTVRAIEQDSRLIRFLKKSVPKKDRMRLDTVEGDLKKIKWEWDEPFQVIGNIPYNLSGLIIRRLTQLQNSPERVILLVQKEVGDRMAAKPGKMNRLGLATQLWAEVTPLVTVPAGCFWPVPQVDSKLMLMVPKNDMTIEAREKIMQIAKIAFSEKRKQMAGVLRKKLNLKIAEKLATIGLNPKVRPEELSIEDWKNLVFDGTP